MLSASQVDEFREYGILKVPGLITEEAINNIQVHTRAYFEDIGYWRQGAWAIDKIPKIAKTDRLQPAKTLKRSKIFTEIMTSETDSVIRSLCEDAEPVLGSDRPQLLFTLPCIEDWDVPSRVWHVDVPRLPDNVFPGVQLFTFVEPVVHAGGGTLAVSGSHRLINEDGYVRSKFMKRRLKRQLYFRRLFNKKVPDRKRFLTESGQADHVPLKVVEMTGEPGDAYITDLRLLHTVAPNANPEPRVMLTQRYYRRSALPLIRLNDRPND